MSKKSLAILIAFILIVAGAFYLYNPPGPAFRPVISDPNCLAAYLRLYEGPVLRIDIVFGYKDARPARFVGDRYERNYFITQVMRLGFTRSEEDDDLFLRKTLGPDGAEKSIELRITASSAGPDDDENRKDAFQAWKTREAENVFLQGVRESRVVFYNGHSRTGGGPDFGPPRLANGLKVDYSFYKKQRPGYQKLRSALAEAKKIELMGLFSCTADAHFTGGLREMRPELGVIASDHLLYYADSLANSLTTLKHILEFKCQPDFVPAGNRLVGFFAARALVPKSSRQDRASCTPEPEPQRGPARCKPLHRPRAF